MNRLGIFMNFWEKNWECDLAKYIKKVSKIGYDILEFQAQAVLGKDKGQLLELKKLADDHNVELTYSLTLNPKYDVSSLDDRIREEGIEYAKRILERIGFMGGKLVSGVCYAGWGCIPSDDVTGNKQPIVERSMASMREIAKTAADYGITCCAEVINRYEGCVMNTAAEAVDFVNNVGADNVGILLDTYHMNIEEDSFWDAIHVAGDKLKGMHFGDNNRRCPGRGHIDFDEIVSALADINYQNQIVTELFVTKGGEVGRDVALWRDLEKDSSEAYLDQEAAHLLVFEKEILQKYGRRA